MDFLPENYEVPQTQSNYMRLEQGENKFRIMGSAIIGYEYWNTENKPVRSPKPFSETPGIKTDKNGKKTIKHFWAFPVWDYKDEKVKILEITQSTIQGAIKNLVDNEDWGNPQDYDVIIKRVGEGIETEYSIMPRPHSGIPQSAMDAYSELSIDLSKLYEGTDPFGERVDTQNI